jgi:signal transduction histidine kinase
MRPSCPANTAAPRAAGPVPLLHVTEQAAEQLRAEHIPGLKAVVFGLAPAWVRASTPLLAKAVDLLLQNAVEAMPQGGVLTLQVDEDEAGPCLSVSDTGRGRSAEASGCLGRCREIVQALGGTVHVVSAEGKGTTVTMSFPPLQGSRLLRTDEPGPVSPSARWMPTPSPACCLV